MCFVIWDFGVGELGIVYVLVEVVLWVDVGVEFIKGEVCGKYISYVF